MEDLFYSTHALQRMKLRSIDESITSLTILDSDGVIKQSSEKKIFYRNFPERKDNMIAVVCIPVRQGILVLTVMNFFEVAK